MKQLIASMTNEFLVRSNGGKITPMTEVVLVVAEPNYLPAKNGDGDDDGFTKEPITDTLRFFAPPDLLRGLAKQFVEYAESAESLGSCVVPAPEVPS